MANFLEEPRPGSVIAPRSPWQNAYGERAIGSIRRECLDHVVVIGERHLREILSKYVDYYNGTRTHLSLSKDAPKLRTVQLPSQGRVVKVPRVGGLHHELLAAGGMRPIGRISGRHNDHIAKRIIARDSSHSHEGHRIGARGRQPRCRWTPGPHRSYGDCSPHFSSLLRAEHPGTPSVFMAFDCLYQSGRDLRSRPFSYRRRALEDAVGDGRQVYAARTPTASTRLVTISCQRTSNEPLATFVPSTWRSTRYVPGNQRRGDGVVEPARSQ